ncbi:MAG: TonB-dependent receptor [Williamsia sp.]|nr:TonB-dependent receptor [Williamsia sp.]
MRVAVFPLLMIALLGGFLSRAQQVTIAGKNLALTDVFESIHKQTGYSFVYGQDLIEHASPVTIQFRNAPLTSVLDRCLKDQSLSYEIKFNTIIIREATGGKGAASSGNEPVSRRMVTGRVTDENNQPLAGATIAVKQTTRAVTTDAAGSFSIRVMNGEILTCSHVGYLSQQVVPGTAGVTVNMEAEVKSLNQMIVIGYGTQKKKNITSAVSTYDANGIAERPLVRVDQALLGQLTGVQVKQTTGVPGKAFSIQVRGTGSVSAGSEPLYVIDGFPLAQANPNGAGSFTSGNPLDNLNPNDIASVQVLKDAAAAAIYGSRAANGVVLITTKKGAIGAPSVSLNCYTGFSEASRKLDMLTANEWVERATEIINAQWVMSGPNRSAAQTGDERRQLLGLPPGQVNTNYMLDDRWALPGHPGLYYIDWQDAALKKGQLQNYQLSAGGGNEWVKYYLSGNYSQQQGLLIGLNYTSYAARSNVEISASKRMKLGINMASAYSLTNDPGVEGKSSIWRMLLSFTPVQENRPGSVNVENSMQYKWANPDNDPVYRLRHNTGLNKRFRTLGSVFASYQLTPSLVFKTTFNLDNTDNSTSSYIPSGATGTFITRQTTPGLITSGSYTTYKQQTFVNENTLSFSKVFRAVHDVSAVAGSAYNSDKLDNTALASLGGYNNNSIPTLNAANSVTGSTMETRNLLLSYFGRLQYGYNSKYLFSASLRKDGSSRFGENARWGLFPSVSAGWRISKEGFFSGNPVFTDLKLRASWGESGNYNIGDYSSIPVLVSGNYTFNNAPAAGQSPGNLVNPDLSWEKSRTLNIGLDAGILGNRITASLDYYKKISSNLLLYVPVPAQTGFITTLSNAGQVSNQGWELELNTHNLTHALKWNTALNISHNANKVTKLGGGQAQLFIPTRYDIPNSILRVGQPMYSIAVVKQIGILTQDDISKRVALFGSETAGDPKYFDANQDGVIDANDRVIVGHPSPDFVWGVTNTLQYKNFDVSILVQGQQGGSIYSLLGRAIGRTGLSFTENELGFYRNRWRSATDPGEGRAGKAYSTFGSIKNTDWLYSSDYWRIRDITLGYNLGNALKTSRLRSARIYATAENFFGRDKYKGGLNVDAVNEDLSGSPIYPDAGDYGGLPLPRSIIIGISIGL